MNIHSIREQMPVTQRWAYFDHAAVAPLPKPALEALSQWANDVAEHGDVHWTSWNDKVERVRTQATRLLNAEASEIAFVKNTSEGIGFVAEGLAWREGDNVITAEDEYPSNVYPWMNLASRGVEVRRVGSREGRILVEDLRQAIDSRTRLLSLSFVEYATGFRNDLDAVGQLCREKDVLFFLDAIQGLGVLPLDVKRTPIDFLAADGHKWMLGPEGAGLFYIRQPLIDQLHPIGVGWNSVVGNFDFDTLDFTLKPSAARWEGGTLNVGGILALGASLEFLLDVGISTISERVLALTDHLCAGAQRRGIGVFSSRRGGEKSGIVALEPAGNVKDWLKKCRDAGIVVNCRGGRLRISPHFYNTTEELDRLLGLLGGSA